ncbi:MAG TPA: hypothetical protein VEI97_16670, partial [bacterium]|nr:hypothetical protein [bacterium]
EPWGSLVDSNMSYVPSGYEGWEPPLGVDGESARYLLLQNPAMTDGPILISLSSPECRQFLNGLSQIPGIGLTAEELGPVALRQVPALAGPEETKLGYFASMLNDATRLSLYAASPGVPPGSLEELAEEYGGQTPSAWINPYTGAAMQNVPLDQATPGNYTEFPHADGVLFAIHYRDQENGTSSVIVGQRGQLDPNHGLLEDIQEANEEAGS